ncbi:MAG TPA: hypothetical protein PKD85_01710 [Saprospiraceae bacterium]|nr:hypothetical protein [Saprospiraceae bacterium]
MSREQKIWSIAILCGAVLLLVIWMRGNKNVEGLYMMKEDLPRSKDGQVIEPPKVKTYNPGYLPSKQSPSPLYFQNLLPSLTTERIYHKHVMDDCDGDYGDFQCRQKSYIKTLKGGTTDKADLLCWRHRFDEDKYYGCLDAIYGNYIWNDRFSGAQPCLCADGTQGASTAYGTCDCPPNRPLHDRRPLDQNYEVVDRLHEF